MRRPPGYGPRPSRPARRHPPDQGRPHRREGFWPCRSSSGCYPARAGQYGGGGRGRSRLRHPPFTPCHPAPPPLLNTLATMASINRVYPARLARMSVLGPMGESLGRVRDVVVSISIVRQQPRVLGLVIEMLSRRRIFVPILRVASFEPNAVPLNTNSVSMSAVDH